MEEVDLLPGEHQTLAYLRLRHLRGIARDLDHDVGPGTATTARAPGHLGLAIVVRGEVAGVMAALPAVIIDGY